MKIGRHSCRVILCIRCWPPTWIAAKRESLDPGFLVWLGDQVADVLSEEGVSTEDLLQALEEEREEYYKEKYVQG